MATDRTIHAPLIRARYTSHHRSVLALDRVLLELVGEFAMRVVCLGDHHDTRGPLVQTVHDSRSFHTADTREISAVVQQRVDERSTRVARAGVYDDSRGFVDDDQSIVLVQDVERNILRLDLRWGERRRGRFEFVSKANLLAGPARLRIDPDAIAIDPAPGL
jgi:hypothetical protein